jgi:hypothetical protein
LVHYPSRAIKHATYSFQPQLQANISRLVDMQLTFSHLRMNLQAIPACKCTFVNMLLLIIVYCQVTKLPGSPDLWAVKKVGLWQHTSGQTCRKATLLTSSLLVHNSAYDA